jgi:hypothetical protein
MSLFNNYLHASQSLGIAQFIHVCGIGSLGGFPVVNATSYPFQKYNNDFI